MSETSVSAKAPMHLWIVGLVSLLWNALGGVDYVMTKTHNEMWLQGFTPEQIAWFDSFPIWANTAWALGVWGAIAGSVLLLLRRSLAYGAFAISVVGLVVGTIHQFIVAEMPAGLDTPGGRAFTALLWAVSIGLFFYARRMRANGVLR